MPSRLNPEVLYWCVERGRRQPATIDQTYWNSFPYGWAPRYYAAGQPDSTPGYAFIECPIHPGERKYEGSELGQLWNNHESDFDLGFMYPRFHSDTGMISYYETPSHCLRDARTYAKASRFLFDILPGADPGKMLELQITLGMAPEGLSERILTEPEDMVKAYNDGPRSCMSGDRRTLVLDGGAGNIHPVSLYAQCQPPVQLMVLYHKQRIIGRAIVDVKQRSYLRIYGAVSVMRSVLEKEGFKLDIGMMVGRSFPVIPVSGGAYAMPYLDGIGRSVVYRDGRFYVVGPSDPLRTGEEGRINA